MQEKEEKKEKDWGSYIWLDGDNEREQNNDFCETEGRHSWNRFHRFVYGGMDICKWRRW